MTDSPFGAGRRDALLIATGTYDDRALSTLRAPAQDCAGLAGVLADPAIGGFHTERLEDAPAHRVMRAVERFFRDRGRDDLLLLHLSCHGIKDEDGHLYFAARDTDRDLPASSAVPAAFLRERMERCRARTVVVLLDCCYSGAFLPGAKGDDQVHVREELGGHGRAVLTATSRTEYAWEGERVESAAPQPSRFTGALIEGLRTGAADLNGDGRITVTELYDYVYESLHRSGARQRPRMWADLEYQVTVARVPAAAARRPSPPPRRGQDALIRLELTLEEVVFGTVKDIPVETAVRCPDCAGSGTRLGSACGRCAGEARIRTRRTLTCKVPGGVENGTRIQLAGEGEVGPGGGPPGDLYLEIVQRPHPVFRRVGDDLHCELLVPAATARAGGEVALDTLDGRKRVRVPPGVRPFQDLRLRGLGVTRLRTDARGDLLAVVHIED
ncbi:caspase, EACC1-associated type [Streptomyces sp. 7R007]